MDWKKKLKQLGEWAVSHSAWEFFKFLLFESILTTLIGFIVFLCKLIFSGSAAEAIALSLSTFAAVLVLMLTVWVLVLVVVQTLTALAHPPKNSPLKSTQADSQHPYSEPKPQSETSEATLKTPNGVTHAQLAEYLTWLPHILPPATPIKTLESVRRFVDTNGVEDLKIRELLAENINSDNAVSVFRRLESLLAAEDSPPAVSCWPTMPTDSFNDLDIRFRCLQNNGTGGLEDQMGPYSEWPHIQECCRQIFGAPVRLDNDVWNQLKNWLLEHHMGGNVDRMLCMQRSEVVRLLRAEVKRKGF
jgi:hypothetical protein